MKMVGLVFAFYVAFIVLIVLVRRSK